MSRRLLASLVTVAISLAALVAVPAIVIAGDPCFHAFDNRPAPSTGRTSSVVLGDCVFTPTVTRVAVGTTVTWRNASSQDHEVVGSNMTWGAHKKLLSPGDTIGWTFESTGTYGYSCMIHPGMTGVIVVGDPAEAAAAADDVSVASDIERGANGGGEATDGGGAMIAALAGAGGLALGLALAGLLRRSRPEPPTA